MCGVMQGVPPLFPSTLPSLLPFLPSPLLPSLPQMSVSAHVQLHLPCSTTLVAIGCTFSGHLFPVVHTLFIQMALPIHCPRSVGLVLCGEQCFQCATWTHSASPAPLTCTGAWRHAAALGFTKIKGLFLHSCCKHQ